MGKLSSEEFAELLRCWAEGDDHALDEVLEDVYDHLRGIANKFLHNERKGHTLQPTALVHEAFLKLGARPKIKWASREHFLAVLAIAMRRVLIDYARKRNREKGPGKHVIVPLDEALVVSDANSASLLILDEALNSLARKNSRRARVVELRVFGGLENEEVAAVLGTSSNTVIRDWNMALAELGSLMRNGSADDRGTKKED